MTIEERSPIPTILWKKGSILMNRKWLTIGLCCLLLCCLVFLPACSVADTALAEMENEELTQMTRQMTDAIISDDLESGYQLVKNVTTRENFTQVFSELQTYMEGVETYTLSLLNIEYTTNTSQVTQCTSIYLLKSNAGEFRVTTKTLSDTEGLAGYYVEKYMEKAYTGTLATMEGANALQWILLLVGVAAKAFMVWALVDCIRHPMKKLKWLWIIFIILGFVAVLWTVGNGSFNMTFTFFALFAQTSLIIYTNPAGLYQLQLVLPVGAIA